MLNDDKPAEEEAAGRGEVLPEEQRPSYLFYQEHKTDMDSGAEISWPQVRSLYWLMRARAKNKKAFDTEMQGEPRSDEDKTFSNVRFYVSRLAHWIMFGACDPSMGNGQKSDPSCIMAGAWDRERSKLHVEYSSQKRRLPSKLEEDLVNFQLEFQCLAIAFENNNAYEHSRQTFVTNGLRKGVALPLIGITETVSPEVRYDSLEPYINDAMEPRMLFNPALVQLLAQLDSWPELQQGHHYDGLSALYLLWKLASTRGGSIGAMGGFQSISRRQGDGDNGGRRMF